MPAKKKRQAASQGQVLSSTENDVRFMRRALELAQQAKGLTSPNPTTGAVITYQDQIIAEGYHHAAGKPHAEIEAIRQAQRKGWSDFSGCTLYVTLEPCCTHGRTPPCTDAIIEAKFSRVVIAATDPNPAHAGRAFTILKRAGIMVRHGLLAKEAAWLNRDFNHFIVNGTPWVVAKYATSLDGRLAPAANQPRWLTGSAARDHAMRYRLHADAILIGAGTLRIDNPRLTLRKVPTSHREKRPLIPVILTRGGSLPSSARLLCSAQKPPPIIYHHCAWPQILADLGARNIMHLIIEGGPTTLASAFEAGIIHEIHHYLAPKLLGGSGVIPPWQARPYFFTLSQTLSLGNDLFNLYMRSEKPSTKDKNSLGQRQRVH